MLLYNITIFLGSPYKLYTYIRTIPLTFVYPDLEFHIIIIFFYRYTDLIRVRIKKLISKYSKE